MQSNLYQTRLSIGVFGCLLASWLGQTAAADAEDRLYGQTIVCPSPTGLGLTAVVNDAAATLHTVTGHEFRVTDQPTTPAIELRFDNSGSSAALAASPEAFTIRSKSSEQMLITASSEQGLIYGLYYYLDQLGCRWFFPGDNWTVLPAREDVTLTIDQTVSPAFRSRRFFGTGGFGPPNPTDPKLEVRNRWDRWKLRNGYGGEFSLSGHTGESFNLHHRKTLEEHPEYFAIVNGKRQPWALGTKPCISNPEFRTLYIQDRVRFLRNDTSRFAVSVEPADGGGACQCDKCAAIGTGSVSDRVFFLANEVAKAVDKEFPGHWVNLLAYNDHAEVPTIPLEPNVYVQVVPYAFQRTSMTGDQLLNAWGRKVSRMGLYTYWSIPDWTRDQPVFNWASTPTERIHYWHDNHVESAGFESTYSAGAMGLGQYLSGKLLWDPQRDVKPLVDEFFKECFGPAEPPMRRMLERWAAGYLASKHELGLSFIDLHEAKQLARPNAALAARVDDYVKYVHYLRLVYEMKPGTSLEAVESQRRLITWVWRINDSCMIHSFRISKLVAYRWANNPSLQEEFSPKDKNTPGWASVQSVPKEELAALLADGTSKYKPLDFKPRVFSSELIATALVAGGSPTQFSKPLKSWGNISFELDAAANLKHLPLKIQVNQRHGNAGDPLTMRNSAGRTVYETTVPPDGKLHDISVPIPSPGRYTLEIYDPKRIVAIQLPLDVPLISRGFISTANSPRCYFYVPEGTEKIVMYLEGSALAKFRDSTGKLVPSEDHGLTVVPVEASQAGRIWSIESFKAHKPLRALNVPSVFAFSPNTLMYPKELASEVQLK